MCNLCQLSSGIEIYISSIMRQTWAKYLVTQRTYFFTGFNICYCSSKGQWVWLPVVLALSTYIKICMHSKTDVVCVSVRFGNTMPCIWGEPEWAPHKRFSCARIMSWYVRPSSAWGAIYSVHSARFISNTSLEAAWKNFHMWRVSRRLHKAMLEEDGQSISVPKSPDDKRDRRLKRRPSCISY